ncbi:MAG: hypothetical protein WDO14_14175 [Bacteroidota bacterium]
MLSKRVKLAAIDIIGLTVDTSSKLPVSSVVKSLSKLGSSLRKRFLEEKIQKFLIETSDLSDKERIQMMKLVDDYGTDFYERLWQIIDRNDTVYKTQIIARLTKAVARRVLNIDDYHILCKIVNDAHTSDLKWLYAWISKKIAKQATKEDSKIRIRTLQRLAVVGLTNTGGIHQLTPDCRELLTHGFEKSPDFKAFVSL